MHLQVKPAEQIQNEGGEEAEEEEFDDDEVLEEAEASDTDAKGTFKALFSQSNHIILYASCSCAACVLST